MWWGGAGFCGRDTGPGEKQKLGADTEGESTDEPDTGTRKGAEGRGCRLKCQHGLLSADLGPQCQHGLCRPPSSLWGCFEPGGTSGDFFPLFPVSLNYLSWVEVQEPFLDEAVSGKSVKLGTKCKSTFSVVESRIRR